ncbi:MAG: CoA synthetase [Rhodospirillaceae bacterium]|nr:CoA synthetase [Rhodospirillaceae bacterium]
MSLLTTTGDLAEKVSDKAFIVLPPDYSNVPMALVFALIRRKMKDLYILFAPIGGIAADLLVGAGNVKTLEAAAITLGEAGLAPRFSEAVQKGTTEFRDSTCPAIHAGLQASEKGVPFMPLRGLIGSDVLNYRDDWKVISNPFNEKDGPIVLLPAIQPDIALIHAPVADSCGNVWIGKRRELMTMSHAARKTFVTVEKVQEQNLLEDDLTAAGTLPNMYVEGIAEAKNGCWPLGLAGFYQPDSDAINAYAKAAETDSGFREWLKRNGNRK